MSTRRSASFLVFLAGVSWFCYCSRVAARSASPIQDPAVADVDAQYKDKLVKLWAPYCGQKLKFDSTGALVSGGELGDSPNCQLMRIQRIAVQNGKLIVAAQRVPGADWATADCTTEPKQKVARETPKADSKAPTHNRPVNGEHVVIEMELPPQSGGTPAMSLMEKLFSVLEEQVFMIGDGVTPPVPMHQPDPSYSAEARKAGYQGTVVLMVIVGPDGKVYHPKVSHSLGMGLDEKAVEAVLTWRFKPATRCGVPVAVKVSIEIEFRM